MRTLLNSFILLGAIQGLIVSALLFSSARRDPAGGRPKRLLSTLLLLLALACLNLYIYSLPGMLNTAIGNLLNALVPLVIVMPIGPLLYFYIRNCLEPGFRLDRRHRRHFYPVVIDLFQHVAALLFVLALITGLLSPHRNYHFGEFLDYYDQYADIPRWLSLVLYCGMAHRYLAKAGRTTPGTAWPRTLLRAFMAFSALWLVFLIPYELPRYSDALINRFDWYPLYLPIVLLIYWLGIKGYFISYGAGKRPRGQALLSPDVAGPVVSALKKAMEEDTLWLDPELNLGTLARHCGTAPKTLSAVLNQHLEKTFNEYVNEYRVGAFKERLLQPGSRQLTIAGLAYDCGFNSLPTFQRAFKSVTGLSPKEFLRKADQIRI
jgi:AraC-like DNA-binding protein